MLDPASAAAIYPQGLDAPARLRILADSYGLSLQERAELPGVIEQATQTCREFVAGGDANYARALTDRGGWERWDRMQAWQFAHRETFTNALLR